MRRLPPLPPPPQSPRQAAAFAIVSAVFCGLVSDFVVVKPRSSPLVQFGLRLARRHSSVVPALLQDMDYAQRRCIDT